VHPVPAARIALLAALGLLLAGCGGGAGIDAARHADRDD